MNARRAYCGLLDDFARTFGHKGKAQIGVDITFAALSIAGSIAVTGPVGIVIGVGIAATGFGASHAPPP